MKKIAMVAAMVGALGVGSVATTSPAEAHWRGGWGPGIAGGLIAGAVIGGVASSAYGWGPGYGYYGGPGYYGAGYYGGPYAYDDGYDAPYRWGGYATRTYYSAPVSYGYRYSASGKAGVRLLRGRIPGCAAPLASSLVNHDDVRAALRTDAARPFAGAAGHHQLPARNSRRSDAIRRSGVIIEGLAAVFLRRRFSARLRTSASLFVADGDGAAAIAERTSPEACSTASGMGSTFANAGAAVRVRVSNTIFSGRLRAEWIRIMVLSGSEACLVSGGIGRYRSIANSSATSTLPTKTKYLMIGMDRRSQLGLSADGGPVSGPAATELFDLLDHGPGRGIDKHDALARVDVTVLGQRGTPLGGNRLEFDFTWDRRADDDLLAALDRPDLMLRDVGADLGAILGLDLHRSGVSGARGRDDGGLCHSAGREQRSGGGNQQQFLHHVLLAA